MTESGRSKLSRFRRSWIRWLRTSRHREIRASSISRPGSVILLMSRMRYRGTAGIRHGCFVHSPQRCWREPKPRPFAFAMLTRTTPPSEMPGSLHTPIPPLHQLIRTPAVSYDHAIFSPMTFSLITFSLSSPLACTDSRTPREALRTRLRRRGWALRHPSGHRCSSSGGQRPSSCGRPFEVMESEHVESVRWSRIDACTKLQGFGCLGQ